MYRNLSSSLTLKFCCLIFVQSATEKVLDTYVSIFWNFSLNTMFLKINARIAFSDLSFDILALIDYNKHRGVLECFNLFAVSTTFE
jgi:hypothetical protein